MISGDRSSSTDAPIEMMSDKVRQDFGIGLGSESMVLALEFEA
jgi:hypothetical protein